MSTGRYRTDLARARGLGPAKTGAGHWLSERITSILLAPLSICAPSATYHIDTLGNSRSRCFLV